MALAVLRVMRQETPLMRDQQHLVPALVPLELLAPSMVLVLSMVLELALLV